MGTEDPTKKEDSTEGQPGTPAPEPFDWTRDDVVVLEDDGDSY